MDNRKLIRKKELIVILVIIAIGVGILVFLNHFFSQPGVEDTTPAPVVEETSDPVDEGAESTDPTQENGDDYEPDEVETTPAQEEAVIFGRIYFGAEVAKVVPLNVDQTFSVEQNPNVVFQVEDGAIAFVKSNCLDQICVNVGFIRSPWHFAACLPNVLLLSISVDAPVPESNE